MDTSQNMNAQDMSGLDVYVADEFKDTFRKVVRDNVTGNFESTSLADALSVLFSNTTKVNIALLGETLIRHFLLNEKDLKLLGHLDAKRIEFASLAMDKKQQQEMLDTLKKHRQSSLKPNASYYDRIEKTLNKNIDVIKDRMSRYPALLERYKVKLSDTPEKILDKVVSKRYGEYLFRKMGSVFSYGNLLKALLTEFDSSSSESVLDWATTLDSAIANLFTEGFVRGKKEYLGFLNNFRLMSAKNLAAMAARGILVGIVTDLTFKVSYAAGKFIFNDVTKWFTGSTLYEKEGFINATDAILPALLNDLSGNELDNAMTVRLLLTNTFRNEDNDIIDLNDVSFLFGSDEYRDMDYQKVKNVYQGLYNLMTGKTERLSINTSQEFKEHLQSKQVIELFKQYRGKKLMSFNGFTPEFMSRQITEPDPIGISWRYALKNLNSFVVEDASFYTKERLGKEQFDSLKLFDIRDPSTASGMTKEYIEHRLDMLGNLNSRIPKVTYKDIASGLLIKPIGSDRPGATIPANDETITIFGTDKAEDQGELTGKEKDDHIFAGGGNDVLNGGRGNDYLEGGTGFDTYHIEGNDTVFDADGKGELIFGKDKVAYFIPATSNSQNSWISSNSSGEADNKFRAVREGNHLLITSVADEANKVTIRDYFSGRNTLDGTLGLNVVKPINDEGNAKEYTITPNSNNVHNEYHLGPYSYAVNGNPLNDLIFAANSRQGKTGFGLLTNTGAGNDIVFGSFYPDVIEGGADTDILSGSNHPGKLTEAQKALDNDIIAGNDGSDFIFGKAGNDILHGGNAEEYLSEDTLEGQGDWINGGEGSDKLYGSRAQDVLQGGAGSDELYGGAGNDLIVGDSDHEVRAHVMRRFEENYYPLTHIHRYNRDKDEFDPIERMKLRQKLDEESAKWTLKIDSKTQNYSISRNYSDWDNKGTYLAADKGGAADYLEGGAGNDMLIGQRGDDTLYGQSGDDILFGDDNHDKSIVGNDHLRGGSGSDTLIGGKGADKYYFFRDELKAEAGESAPIDTIIDDGRGEGNQLDEIYLDGYPITAFEWNFDKIAQRWAHASGWQIIKNGNMLNISHKDEAGRIVVKDYADGDYGLRLSENDNKPSPEPVNPEPPKPEQPKPEQPKAPTAGKPLTAQSIHEKQRLAYTLAEDAFHTANQDDKLAYSARLADGKPLPRWLSFNAATRTFSGTPGNDDVGMLNIEVSAKGKGGSASQRLTLNVINVNDAPQIGAAIANHTSESGKPLQYRLPSNAFKDIDKGDALTLSAKLENGQPLPSWLSFDGKTGQFSGTPPSSRTANNYRIAVTATDKGGLSTRQNFTLSIKPAANQPPRVALNLPVQKMNEKSRWQYTIPANAFHDADGDSLSYSATQADGNPLPKWLNFNAANRTFSGTPGNDDVGNLALRITASDNRGGVASQNLALQIANVNDAPQIGAAIANHTSESGKPLQYRLPSNAFKDIDKGDALTLSAKLENGQPLPSWLSFDGKTGQFSGTPPSSRTANNYRIAVTATDKGGLSTRQNFTLSIKPAANQPPRVALNLPVQKMNEKSRWQYTIPANAFHDADGDSLSYSATQADGNPLPKWLNFNAANRTFSGTPGNDDVGNLALRITASDNRGGVASQNLALQIANVNDAPQIGAAIANHTSESGKPLQYRLPSNAFKDIDKGDALTLSAKLENGQSLPSWLSFDGKTGQFSGTPPSSRTANNYRIAVTATDKAGAQVSQKFSLITTAGAINIIRGNGKEATLQGTSGNDTIYVNDNPMKTGNHKEVYGYDGDDEIYGGSGRDAIYGGAGNDILYTNGTEHDSLYGGYGDDIYRLGADFRSVSIENFDLKQYDWRPQRRDVIEFMAHKRDYFNIYRTGDNLYLQGRDGQEVSIFDQFSNQGNNQHYINEFRFTDKTLTAADIKALLSNGTPGNDTLYAKPEGSRLYSGDGDDRIFGNQGNDYLYGEAGNDKIYGGAGDDYLWGETGNDLLYGGTGKDMLNGGSGDDQLYGEAGDDRLFGYKGNDVLHGGEGNDKLDGSLDDDWLFGEAGNDELFGSTGNDVLNGGSGNDQLIGHEGNDIYQFQSDFGEDIIQNESNPAMLAGSQYDRIDFLDLKPDDLYFRKIGDNLVIISKKRAQNRVTVLEHFRDNGNTAARIDEIRFVDGTKLDYAAINRLVQKNSSGNAASADSVRRGNLFASDAAHQAQQINQAIAALNGQAQPLHALAIPDEKQPLLTTVNPY